MEAIMELSKIIKAMPCMGKDSDSEREKECSV
jgi:hypothetical protein